MEDVDEFYARVKDKVNLLFELADEPYCDIWVGREAATGE